MKTSLWYYNRDLKPQGPLSTEEIRLKIYRGEISPQDLVFSVGEDLWKAAERWKCFEDTLFPSRQNVKSNSAHLPERAEWVLLIDSKQEGPFSSLQVQNLFNEGLLLPEQLIWKAGLSGWSKLQDRAEFQTVFNSEHL